MMALGAVLALCGSCGEDCGAVAAALLESAVPRVRAHSASPLSLALLDACLRRLVVQPDHPRVMRTMANALALCARSADLRVQRRAKQVAAAIASGGDALARLSMAQPSLFASVVTEQSSKRARDVEQRLDLFDTSDLFFLHQ